MEIGKVKFGEYSVGNGQVGSGKKGEEKQEVQTNAQVQSEKAKTVKAEDVYNALGALGTQNMAFITKNAGVGDVEAATKLLGEERTSDIEAMMAEFENGVNDIANIIDDEFGDIFSEPEKNALAARIFAKE